MHDDDRQMIVQITAIDLETNSIETSEIIVPKTVERKFVKDGQEILGERENSAGKKVYLVRATESEIDMTRKALISKALRNAIFRLVPAELVQTALDTARKTIRSADAKDPKDATRRLIACFGEQGVTVDQIELYIGHTLDKATTADGTPRRLQTDHKRERHLGRDHSPRSEERSSRRAECPRRRGRSQGGQ